MLNKSKRLDRAPIQSYTHHSHVHVPSMGAKMILLLLHKLYETLFPRRVSLQLDRLMAMNR